MNRKNVIRIMAGFLMAVVSPFVAGSASLLGEEPLKSRFFTLENGMLVYVEKREKVPLANMAAAVNVGSASESAGSNGYVHLLEHLLLLGGSRRWTGEQLIERYIRGRGFYFNAHTMHDIMTLELSAPGGYWREGLELFREKLLNLDFREAETENEKKAILEELSQTRDDPEKRGIQRVLAELFRGHPYGLPVAGAESVIRGAGGPALMEIYKRYFAPGAMALVLMGDIDVAEAEKEVRRLFGGDSTAAPAAVVLPRAAPLAENVEILERMDIRQAHLFVGFQAPAMDDEDKATMDVLNQILGKGVQPLLYSALNRQRELALEFSMNYLTMKQGGAVVIHVKTDEKNVKSVRNQLVSFLRELRSFRFSATDYLYGERNNVRDYLENARTWLELAMEEFREEGMNLALSYARYMLMHESDEKRSYSERLKAIRSRDLQKTAERWFRRTKYVAVTILPLEKGEERGEKK